MIEKIKAAQQGQQIDGQRRSAHLFKKDNGPWKHLTIKQKLVLYLDNIAKTNSPLNCLILIVFFLLKVFLFCVAYKGTWWHILGPVWFR